MPLADDVTSTGVDLPQIPGYAYVELIGRGGMGSVYAADELSHQRRVAIKVLSEALRDDGASVDRFHHEAQLLAKLEHPHIVPMLDSGEADGVPYIVMRFIEGPNLRDLVRLGPLDPRDAVEILDGVAQAIDFAHARGVLHRDIKPHNVLLDHGGHPWLADFGLNQLAGGPQSLRSAGEMAGTFDYLAPEVTAGRRASAASDIYAFAITAFQLLTGRLPFGAERTGGGLLAHVTQPRPAASALNPLLPARVDSLLADGMAVDPRSRPASAGAFVQGLAEALAHPRRRPRFPLITTLSLTPAGAGSRTEAQIEAGPPATTGESFAITMSERRPLRRTRRRRTALGGVCLTLCLGGVFLVAGLIVTSHRARAAGVHPETARRATATWFDFTGAGGRAGPVIPAATQVEVSCRIAGRRDGAGNPWWYRIASRAWDEQFYAPAAAFSGVAFDAKVPRCASFVEVPGNATGTHTWADPQDGGGLEGKLVPGFTPAEIICRVRGLTVQDGNVWWYRIGGPPWNGHFYASADAFYNDGETSGTLRGSAFVDLDVPLCDGRDRSRS